MDACLPFYWSHNRFLFGIPKILQSNQAKIPESDNAEVTKIDLSKQAPIYQQQVNTNLTEISDWLTKIIVGLGLVNLTRIPPFLNNAATILASGLSEPQITPSKMAIASAYGIIIAYTIFGFLFAYITTRLYLAVLFSEADQRTLLSIAQKTERTAQKTEEIAQKAKEAAGAAQSALQKAEFALITSPDTSLHGSSLENLLQSAANYNEIRNTMKPGPARTSKMTEVVKGMMAIISLIETYDIDAALKDRNDGKRLIGYVWLNVKPNEEYLGELVDAIATDPTAFGQYWGIQALSKIIKHRTSEKMDPTVFNKLKSYYNRLDKGIDREYELARILPELKK